MEYCGALPFRPGWVPNHPNVPSSSPTRGPKRGLMEGRARGGLGVGGSQMAAQCCALTLTGRPVGIAFFSTSGLPINPQRAGCWDTRNTWDLSYGQFSCVIVLCSITSQITFFFELYGFLSGTLPGRGFYLNLCRPRRSQWGRGKSTPGKA